MTNRYILGILATNRVGIMAAVSRAISELGGKLEEVRQTILQEHFSLVLSAEFPEHLTTEVLKDHMEGICRSFGGQVVVKDPLGVPEDSVLIPVANRYRLKLTGHDRTGLIQQLSSMLAQQQIDIIEMYASRDALEETFLIEMDLSVPVDVKIPEIELDIQQWATRYGASVEFTSLGTPDSSLSLMDSDPGLKASFLVENG